MTNQPTISLCMITRNDEAFLRSTIECVESVISEIVIVDTGSTDNTIALAEELGAKVFRHTWNGDFSAARNVAIDKASSQWILVLDPEEHIAADELSIIKHYLVDDRVCVEFCLRHYTNDHSKGFLKPVRAEYPEFEQEYEGYFETSQVRLFPRLPGLRYEGETNELLEPSVHRTGGLRIIRSRVPFHHHGYAHEIREGKDRLNILPRLSAAQQGYDQAEWERYYHLGLEHRNAGRPEEGIAAFLQAIDLDPRDVSSWLQVGTLLCQLGRYDEAVSALETVLKINPDSPEAFCELGTIELWRRNYPLAEQYFKRAISLNDKHIDAYCNLGTVLALTKRSAEAEQMFTKALKFLPNCATIKVDLGVIHFSAGRVGQAKELFLEAIDDDPMLIKAYYQLGQLYKSQNLTTDAIQALEKYCDLADKKLRLTPTDKFRNTIGQVRNECNLLKRRMLVDHALASERVQASC